ncbi:MAG: DUF1573 domain-containing protein [Spirochaetaceae bacterium]
MYKTLKLIILLLILPGYLFSLEVPEEIYLGDLPNLEKVSTVLELTNKKDEEILITLYSLCDCLVVSPISTTINPGETKQITFSLTPEGYDEISRHALIDINGEKSKIKIYAKLPAPPEKPLTGGCPECAKKEKEIADLESATHLMDTWLITDIYYSPGCTTCEEFIDNTVPMLEKDLNKTITVNKHNVLESSELENLESRLKELDVPLSGFPVLIYNSHVLQGEDVSGDQFTQIINGDNTLEQKEGYVDGIDYLKPIPIFLAGLLDGINPCAFTTLLFLISSLFYIGRGKKEILQIGIIFSATIFFSYYLVGLGFLNIIRTANFFPIVSEIIKYILILALSILGIMSFYDAYLVKKGVSTEMKLQLPRSLKKRIHSVIRENTRTRGLIIGTIIIGVMVTIFELTCTGQVYLPIIAYIIKIEGNLSSYFYLTLYNVGFIIPLLIVFLTVYKGTTNQKLAEWFKTRLFYIKILLGLLFLSMIFFI